MQNTSTLFKKKIKEASRQFQCKVTIGDRIYNNEDVVDIIIEHPQPTDGFTIGNTPSKTLDLTILNKGDTIYSANQVKVEIGINTGTIIEYILMGYFNIDDIEKTDYTTKITSYDNMIKFETPYFSNLTYPATLQQVVNELASKTGVQFTGSLPSYTVKKLEGFTCREILGYVASLCGGNALITREGKFTIVIPHDVNYSIGADNYFDYKREEVKYKISKISCKAGDAELIKGSLGVDSMELTFENPWVTDFILTDIYNKLNGFEYLGYAMKWQGDLSLEPGDIVSITDKKGVTRKVPILSQKFTYTGGLTAEIGAKGETKNKNSYNSTGENAKKLERVVTELAIVNKALIDVAYIKDLTASNIKFDTASGGVLNLQSLLANFISGDNGQFIHLTGGNVVIDNATIKDAMIDTLSLNKVLAGDISTNKFRIVSDSGRMLIADNTIQIKDATRVRVQIGKDASNDYNMYLWDSAGKLMFDATGLKAEGIKSKIIRNDMVSDTANISGSKLDIASVITSINNDGSTTIKGNKIKLDEAGQTLDVEFKKLTTTVGITVKKVDVMYYLSTSPTALTGGSWSTVAPTWVNGKYMWSKTVTTLSSGTTVESNPTCIAGAKGEDGVSGKDGKGISSFVEQYYLSTSNTTQINGSWSDTPPTWVNGKYMWTRSIITYTDNTSKITEPICVTGAKGETGQQGLQGEKGADGVQLYTWLKYADTPTSGMSDSPAGKAYIGLAYNKTTSTESSNYSDYTWSLVKGEKGDTGLKGSSGTDGKTYYTWLKYADSPTSGMSDAPDGKKYIGLAYNKETQTESTSYGDYTWSLIKGDKGEKGDNGVSITTVDVEYGISSSPTTEPTAWSTTSPAWVDGKFIWSRTKTTYSTGTSTYSKAVCITGAKGSTGNTGASGTTITSITEEYYLSTSKTTQTGGSWVTSPPAWSTGRYMWTRSKIVYVNPSKTEYTTPVCDSSWEAINDLEFGVRNLLLKSDTKHVSSSYNIASYYYSIPPTLGETYTLLIKGKLGSGKIYFGAYNSGGNQQLCTLSTPNSNGVYSATFPWKIYGNSTDPGANKYLNIYQMPQSVTVESTIEWAMLVKGNKSVTDWISAPEDTEEKITENTMSIKNANGKIQDLIKETTITKENGQVVGLKDAYISTEKTVNGITSIVSNLETTVNGTGGLTTKMETVEQKVTSNAIINTVKDAKTDGKATFATTSTVEQLNNEVNFKFTDVGSPNLYRNSYFENFDTSGWTIEGCYKYFPNPEVFTPCQGWVAFNMTGGVNRALMYQAFNNNYCLQRNTTYTLSLSSTTEANVEKMNVYIKYWNGNTNVAGQSYPLKTGKAYDRYSVTFKTVDMDYTWVQVFFDVYRKAGTTGYTVFSIGLPCLCKGTSASYNNRANEVYTGNTRVSADGVTIYNGALTVVNKSGQNVISADSNGDISFRGKLQPNDYQVKLFGNNCQIDGSANAIRMQYDPTRYVAMDSAGYMRVFNQRSSGGTNYVSLGVNNEGHTILFCGRTMLKLLGGSQPGVQARWGGDGGYCPMQASDFINNSTIKAKTNIGDLNIGNAIDIVRNNNIRTYQLKTDITNDGLDEKTTLWDSNAPIKTGLIIEELTPQAKDMLVPKDTDCISLYSMVSLLWGVVQEQQKQIETQQKSIDELKSLVIKD